MHLIRRAIADCCPQSCVWRVSTGSDALTFLRREPPFVNAPVPALILLDLNLPQLDGRDLLPLLRRLGAYQKTPVVIISGSKRAVEEPRCRQLGATAYVEKSRDFAAYFGEVQASLRHWRGTEGLPS